MFPLILEFIGTQELLLIMVVALVVFGPRKLPELGRSLGKSLNEFKRASEDFKKTWEMEAEIENVEKDSREAKLMTATTLPTPEIRDDKDYRGDNGANLESSQTSTYTGINVFDETLPISATELNDADANDKDSDENLADVKSTNDKLMNDKSVNDTSVSPLIPDNTIARERRPTAVATADARAANPDSQI